MRPLKLCRPLHLYFFFKRTKTRKPLSFRVLFLFPLVYCPVLESDGGSYRRYVPRLKLDSVAGRDVTPVSL